MTVKIVGHSFMNVCAIELLTMDGKIPIFS